MKISAQSIEGFQLSPQQRRLWQLQQRNRHPYRVHITVRIQGNLNLNYLESALQQVVERHEILRTTFQMLPGMTMPLQVVATTAAPVVEYDDFKDFDPDAQAKNVAARINQATQALFNLEQAPVMNVVLNSLSSDRHLLLIGLPALCADRTSLKQLVQEISRAYTACLQGETLTDEPLQYGDLAAWQNELFEDETAAVSNAFWRHQSVAIGLPWTLPLECRSDHQLFQPCVHSVILQSDQVKAIESLAHQHDTSVLIVLLTCWQVLLWRLTNSSEQVIGFGCDGRNYSELESALGPLARYLPLPISVMGNMSFSQVMQRVSQSVQQVYEWQETFRWEDVTEPSANSTEVPFLPICFDFAEQTETYAAANLAFTIDQLYDCIDRYNLKLSCVVSKNEIAADFHYNAHSFQLSDVERIGHLFQTLLNSAINQPQVLIDELNILDNRTYQTLLTEFNQTKTCDYRRECIHHSFEQQAARTPNDTAVVYENQQLTYATLNERANQLAHYLQTVGVGSETIVALWVERSLDMIVGLLGILKAGGAYLPLDPRIPAERLIFMVQNAGATILVTQQHLAQRYPEPALPVLCLDTDWQTIAQHDDSNSINKNPSSVTTPENLMYVIYTSGSTGQPKGVAVEHRQLCNYLCGVIERLTLPAKASFAIVSTFAADLGHTALFPALCTGGCLHIISPERATNPDAFAEYCDRHSIDCLKIVPSHLNALLTAANPAKILPKTYLILGGESLSWNLVETIRSCQPTCQILNHYGPTETTVGVLTYLVPDEPTAYPAETVPVGRPIANTQVYILDAALRPVPIGVAGELYIGGDSLARGYWNQMELTNDRFISHSFPETPETLGTRLYKTGDRARYLPDGNIECLGRIDHQVKIHGFRVELGEIESVLRCHPAIRESVVLSETEATGQQRLIAYVVFNPSLQCSVHDLRDFLNERLPQYMVPTAWVPLKALPLTSTGKIDRQRLPAPDRVRPDLNGEFVTPRTPTETTLARIWAQVLGVAQVGIYDNFFELGGDSIISIQITARANQSNLHITPKQLFEHPTIAELAAVASTASTPQTEQGLVTGSLPLTPIQHWFFEQNLHDPHHWNQSVLLETSEVVDPACLEQAVDYLLQHHDALRLRFFANSAGWQSIHAELNTVLDSIPNSILDSVTDIALDNSSVLPFSCVDLSELPAVAQRAALEATATEVQASLNLTSSPLMRLTLFQMGDQPSCLLWVIHHLVVDGVSWRILLDDLQHIYQQLQRGETVALPAKTTSFKQWSECLQHYAHSTQIQQEYNHWLTTSRSPVSRLPIDHPTGTNTVASSRTVLVSLSVEATHALLQEVPHAYQTQINDVLLTALVQALAEWMQTDTLLLDLEGHGREAGSLGSQVAIAKDVDLSRTVGWFTSIFPVRLTLAGISQPGEALKAIKEQLRSIPNRGIGYGVLRYLSQDESISTQLQTLPQSEVRFNYLGQFDQVLPESSVFKLANQTIGVERSLRSDRHYLLDINGMVLKGQLQLQWTYSEHIHERSTIEAVAQAFITALSALIAHCTSSNVGGYTSSDFPQANLAQADLEQFLAKITRPNQRTGE